MRNYSLCLVAAALLTAACDEVESRKGDVALSGSEVIPLINEDGRAAALIDGPAGVTVRFARSRVSVEILQGANAIRFSAKVDGNLDSGNFRLAGADIGQPVDITSTRAFKLLDLPLLVRSETVFVGSRQCLVDVTYQRCDARWTVDFQKAGRPDAPLGAFVSAWRDECEIARGWNYACVNPANSPNSPNFPGTSEPFSQRVPSFNVPRGDPFSGS